MAREIHLLPVEKTLLERFFLGALDLRKLRVVESRLSLGAAYTLGNTIHMRVEDQWEKNRETSQGRYLLVHEAVHVWQYQQIGLRYAASLLEQLAAIAHTGSRHEAYRFHLLPERPLQAYGIEQQAQLLSAYCLAWQMGNDGRLRRDCRDFVRIGRENALEICERRRQEVRR